MEDFSLYVLDITMNSVRAKADEISVEISESGEWLDFTVTDNGCGMSAEDLPLAVRRHATSKIQSAEDLASIGTLGFRGEALRPGCKADPDRHFHGRVHRADGGGKPAALQCHRHSCGLRLQLRKGYYPESDPPDGSAAEAQLSLREAGSPDLRRV